MPAPYKYFFMGKTLASIDDPANVKLKTARSDYNDYNFIQSFFESFYKLKFLLDEPKK